MGSGAEGIREEKCLSYMLEAKDTKWLYQASWIYPSSVVGILFLCLYTFGIAV